MRLSVVQSHHNKSYNQYSTRILLIPLEEKLQLCGSYKEDKNGFPMINLQQMTSITTVSECSAQKK
jgi:hypothetical protein